MKTYDPNCGENIPWFEMEKVEDFERVPSKFMEAAKSLHYNGYCVLETEESHELIDSLNEGIFNHLKKDNPKLNPDFYHYNSSPRIIEGWKHIPSIVELANNKNVLDFLKVMYERDPLPFSTINFLKSSEQPLHSDYMHFSSIPERYLCGVWFALEDIHKDSGPLAVVKNSRELPILSIDDLGLEIPKNTRHLKSNYTIYEDAVRNIVEDNNLTKEPATLKKGQCLIWAANTLHGGSPINNPSLTRKSLVVHYHFSGCEYYNPGFTSFKDKKIAERKLELIK